ncbi:MAG: hypothetical protein KJN60_08995, partial [Boseongicola sp.]|nr:hypothetical protein [Boseongicola sp.]
MAKGLAALGMIQARDKRFARQQQEREFGLQNARFSFEEKEAFRSSVIAGVDDVMNSAGAALKNIDTKIAAMPDGPQKEAAVQQRQSIIDAVHGQVEMLVQSAAMTDPQRAQQYNSMLNRVGALSLTPTPLEAGAVDAQVAAQSTTATTDASRDADLRAAGLDPASEEAKDLVRRQLEPRGPDVTNNIVIDEAEQNARSEGLEELAKLDVKQIAAARDSAESAQKTIDSLSFIRRQLPEIQQGKLTGFRRAFGALLDAFDIKPELIGVSVDEIAAAEAAGGAMAALALAKAEEMSGTLSDNDINFLTSMGPRLSNTAKGNEMLIDSLEAMQQRVIDKQIAMENYFEENGQSLRGFNKQWSEYARENPLYPPVDSDEVKSALSGEPFSV